MQSKLFQNTWSYFALTIVVGYLWTGAEGKPPGMENSLQTFNKTVRDAIRRQQWLQRLEQMVNRNASGGPRPNSSSKLKAPPLARLPQFTNTRQVNFTGRDNLPDPKDIITLEEKHRLPVMVWSNTIGKFSKSLLTFLLLSL